DRWRCSRMSDPIDRRHRRGLLALVASMTIAVILSACSGGNEETASTTAPLAPSSTTTTTAPPAYDFGEVSELMEAFVTQRGLSGAGLIVLESDDGIVHEEYWGEFDSERTSLVASASKMVSAAVLLKLHDDGVLDIDAPVADVVEWGAGNPDITPAQLLSNSSGLVGIFPNPVYLPYICQYLPEGGLGDCGATIFTTTEDDSDVILPDTEFRYGGAQWQVAGAIAEAASGRSWAELLDETYVEPCGLDPASLGYSNYISVMGNGIDYPSEFSGDPSTLPITSNPNVEAGAYATPGVFAELVLMYLHGGECGDGQRVLSKESIDRVVADRVDEVYAGSAGPGRGYGMGWWVNRQDGSVYSAGAYGAVPTLKLDEGFGYYLVLEANDATWQAIAAPLDTAIDAAMAAARD
ncbi:MAG: serine hydrolase domain-containing protein, partial [Acidimicrobiia bacterium]